MGQPNNALNVYMNRPDRIRSALEYYLGVKLPEEWKIEKETGFYSVRDSKGRISYRQRDDINRVYAGKFSFLLGLENQQTVNLIYPWRIMEMDCCTYGVQIERIQENNRKNKALYGKEDDFKYRYSKKDFLEPLVNLTLYWGKEKWKEPLSLKDMLSRDMLAKGVPGLKVRTENVITDKNADTEMNADMEILSGKLWEMIENYKVHLIHMRFIPEEALQKMDSDLKYVLGIMKHTQSKKKYMEYIYQNREYFSRIPKSALDVIDVCTGLKNIRKNMEFVYNEESGEEEADLCKALKDIIRDAESKGVKKGVKQGISQGVKQGISQGISQGVKQGTLITLCSLVNDGQIKLEEGARRANLSRKVFQVEMKKAGF